MGLDELLHVDKGAAPENYTNNVVFSTTSALPTRRARGGLQISG
jgi:hypothetical protein